MLRSTAFLLLITAQVWANPVEPKVTLHLWNVPAKGRTHAIQTARRAVFDEFCRRNPQIRIHVLVPLQIEGPAATGNRFLAVAGGVAPDVFSLNSEMVGDFRDQGFLYPLNDYLEAYYERTGELYRGFNAIDQIWQVCHDRGQIDCMPYIEYFQTLYFRKDLFAKVGLPLRPAKDWDELYRFARRLRFDPDKEPGADPQAPRIIGLQILSGSYAGTNYLVYIWAGGGEVVQAYYRRGDELLPVPLPPTDYRKFRIGLANQEEYDTRRRSIIEDLKSRGIPTDYSFGDLELRLVTNSPAAMEALKFQRRLVHQPWLRNGDHEFDITEPMFAERRAVDPVTGDVFDLDDPQIQKRIYYGVSEAADFQSGRQGIHRKEIAIWMGTIQDADIWDAKRAISMPFPSRKGVPPAAFVAGEYMAINAAIFPSDKPGRQDVEEIRQAAWKYVQFMTSPEAQKIKMRVFLDHGIAERIKPSLLQEAGLAHLVERIPEHRRLLWERLQHSARIEPFVHGFSQIAGRELRVPLESMINDAPDPRTGAFQRDLQALMDQACHRVNTLILGRMPQEIVQRRQRIGWVIFAVMALGLVLAGYGVVRLALKSQAKNRDDEGFGVGRNLSKRRWHAWALLVPAVGTIFIWVYYPLAKGLVMAFQDYKILGDSTYVGLRNFVEAVSSTDFWRYLLQTFQYMTMLVGIGFCVPIVLAMLLHEIPRGKVFYRVIYYLPAVTTGLVTLFLWKDLLYDPDSNGVINRFTLSMNSWPKAMAAVTKFAVLASFGAIIAGLGLQAFRSTNTTRGRWGAGVTSALGLTLVVWFLVDRMVGAGPAAVVEMIWSKFDFQPQKFLRDPSLAMLWCVLPPIWAGAGPGCLIYLAALKGIPEEQYEAADIDGAGLWHKFWQVTYPNLKALIIINFVGAVIAGFKESGNIFVMTGGGPEDATMTIGLEIWYNAFLYLNFGRATAMAWIMGALLIGFTLNQLRILNKLQFRSTAVEEQVGTGRG